MKPDFSLKLCICTYVPWHWLCSWNDCETTRSDPWTCIHVFVPWHNWPCSRNDCGAHSDSDLDLIHSYNWWLEGVFMVRGCVCVCVLFVCACVSMCVFVCASVRQFVCYLFLFRCVAYVSIYRAPYLLHSITTKVSLRMSRHRDPMVCYASIGPSNLRDLIHDFYV